MSNSRRSSEETQINDADLSREHVVWGYRLFLDREPESEAVIDEKLGLHSSTKDLRRTFMLSPEFGAKNSELTLFHGSHIVIKEIDDHLRIFVDLSDSVIGWGIIRGEYERDELDFVRRTIKTGQTVIDVGANIGVFTITMASLVGPTGKVYAFEPLETETTLIAQSLAENNFGDRVVVVPAAVSNEQGKGQLVRAAQTINAGGAYLTDREQEVPAGHETNAVELITLDTHPLLHPVSFIKIDIEGAEPLALQGARTILMQDRPVILSELHPAQLMKVSGYRPAEFIAEMENLGYQCHDLHESELRPYVDEGPKVKSIVFLPATPV
ncbi:MAG TPA: FkbM family methyltransferase [Pyrinomonadaceae bacterium]